MDSKNSKSPVKFALDCLCSALIGALSCIGGVSFYELNVIALFQEYSKFPYAFVISYFSIVLCAAVLVLLMYSWVVNYMKEDRRNRFLAISAVSFIAGIAVGYPIIYGLTAVIKKYISFCESRAGYDPIYAFLRGVLGIDWLNIFGLVMVVLLLIPNIKYAVKNKNQENKCTNKFMNVLEQIGRYACMIFMIINLEFAVVGFMFVFSYAAYILGNLVLMVSYWVIWDKYFEKQEQWKQMALAIIPTVLFLLSGLTMLNFTLTVSAVIFGIGHIYVTNKNRI